MFMFLSRRHNTFFLCLNSKRFFKRIYFCIFKNFFVEMDRYVHVNNGLIGFGTLGSVSKAKDETSQQNVAIKKMQKVF